MLHTHHLIKPFGSKTIFGIVVPMILLLIGIVGLFSGKSFMFGSTGSTVSGEDTVLIVTGSAAVFANSFWILVAVWFHTLHYWNEHPKLGGYEPLVSNLAIIIALMFGIMAVFVK